MSPVVADFVAKLDEELLARNIRIEAREFLNQHCALALGLESILRAGLLKIVLQQNRPEDEVNGCPLARQLSGGKADSLCEAPGDRQGVEGASPLR
jgi:hypothetical protein